MSTSNVEAGGTAERTLTFAISVAGFGQIHDRRNINITTTRPVKMKKTGNPISRLNLNAKKHVPEVKPKKSSIRMSRILSGPGRNTAASPDAMQQDK